MLAEDYLAHRLIELKPSEEWSHPGDGLHVILSQAGAGRFWISKQSTPHHLSAGDVVAHNGLLLGRLRAAGNLLFSFHHFAARFEHLICLFAPQESSLLQSLIETFHVARHYPASSPLARQCHKFLCDLPPKAGLLRRCQLLRIVSTILSLEMESLPAQRAAYVRAEDHFTHVLESLTPSELVNLHVGELAKRFGCSRRHLNRLFHQHLDTSASAFRMEMRLLKAVALLQNPDAKIINVAEECGFNHLGLFHARFKRRFGSSPGRWRKRGLLDPQPTAGPQSAPRRSRPARSTCGTAKVPLGMEGMAANASVPITIIARKLQELAAEKGIVLSHH